MSCVDLLVFILAQPDFLRRILIDLHHLMSPWCFVDPLLGILLPPFESIPIS